MTFEEKSMSKLVTVVLSIILLSGCVQAESSESSESTAPSPTPFVKLENKAVDGDALVTVTVNAKDGLLLMEKPDLMSDTIRKVDQGTVLSCYGKMTDDYTTRTWYDVRMDDGTDGYLLVYNLADVTESTEDQN